MKGKPLNRREPQLTIRVNQKLWIRREDTAVDPGFAMIVRTIEPANSEGGMRWKVDCSLRLGGSGRRDEFGFYFYADGHGEDETGLRLTVKRFDRIKFLAARQGGI
jgi:hypothetical protein